MENQLISVIVPVYNAEKYLEKCVVSILRQSYKNLELILVNDGSIDKSGEICDKYQCEDKRVIVLHKSNEGVTKARIEGLEVCHGDYVTFIDSDDYVDNKFIESLFSAVKEYHVDACFCQVFYKYENRCVSNVRKISGYLDRQGIDKMLSTDFLYDYSRKEPGLFLGQCGKLFKKKYVCESINYSKGLWVGEDIVMLLHMMYQIHSIYITPMPLYYYVQHSDQTNRKSDDSFWNNIVKHWEKLVEIDSCGFLINQLPYRILQCLELYVRNNIENGISTNDFKVKIGNALLPDIMKKYLLNYKLYNLTIGDWIFIQLIKCECYWLVYYLSKFANLYYKIRKKIKL